MLIGRIEDDNRIAAGRSAFINKHDDTGVDFLHVYEHDFKTCSHADDPIPQPLRRGW